MTLDVSFMIKAEQVSKAREKLIKKIQKEQKHPENAKNQKVIDILDWVIEELDDELYIEDYE